MARRKDDALVNDCYEIFMGVPAWLCIPAAGLVFLVVQIFAFVLAAQGPLFSSLASLAPMVGGMLAMLVLLGGFIAAVDKHKRRGLLDKQTELGSIRELSWSEFELLDGEALARLIQPIRDQPSREVRINAEPKLPIAAPPASVPALFCPRCNSRMILRTARLGSHTDGQFWGCSSYPRCKEIQEFRPIENCAIGA